MEFSGGFPVTVKRTEVVAAVLPVQEYWLPMSNLDLLLPPLDFGIFFCYKKSSENLLPPEKMAAVLQEALAEALVTFYSFAGEIVQNRHGEPELLCNNRGVGFVHASADVKLEDLDLYQPDESVHGKLVPVKTHGVLSVQVTELKCGGLVVGCTFDHRASDAHTANVFISAWAQIARSEPITRLPSFRRSVFDPRRPPQPDDSIDKLYAPLSSMPPPPPEYESQDRLTSRIYYVKAEEIDRLQSQSSYNGTRRSKFESFSAFLWKLIADGSEDGSKMVKLGVVVDGRSRLSGRTTSLESYFGNVLSIPYVEETVGKLQKIPLKEVAEMVHGCVDMAATAEHFLGLIDWVEVRRPNPAVVKVYFKEEKDEAAVVVSSGQRFPVRELDFGWGGPDFGSYNFPWGGETGYVMPMPSVKVNGDWVVYMHLMRKQLDLVEARAGHVFRPFAARDLR